MTKKFNRYWVKVSKTYEFEFGITAGDKPTAELLAKRALGRKIEDNSLPGDYKVEVRKLLF